MSDGLFHILVDTYVVIRRKGVFKQCRVYQRGGRVYAGTAGGFIRLLASGNTTQPDTVWEGEIDHPLVVIDGFHMTVLPVMEVKPALPETCDPIETCDPMKAV